MSELPPGFVLDQPTDTGLPAGFVLDKPSLGEDVAKSAGSGLANAAASTFGALGDVRSLAGHAVDYAGSKLGFDPSKVKNAASIASNAIPGGAVLSNAPSSADILNSVKNADPENLAFYQPQTALGGYAKTATEFLPAMADPELAGPGALRAAGRLFASRVAAPAIASEAAGQATAGTAAEPYARVAGALLGGGGAAKLENSLRAGSALKAATPALTDIKSEASNAYDALTSRNVATPLAQSTLDNLANDITTTLNNKGIRPSNAGTIHQAIAEIRSPATAGAADVADLVAARQSIKELLTKSDTNKAGAFVAMNKIDQAIEQNSPGTMRQLKDADKNWSAMKANEALDKRLAKADLRASATDSGMNVGNKIRQNVATYLGSNEARYLSPETRSDLEKIVRGTWTQNGMRAVANLMGGGGGIGMLAGGTAGYEAGGWPGAIAGAAIGRGFKIANNRSVTKQAERAADAIRRRSPLGQNTPLVLPPSTNVSLAALRPALLARPRD